MLEAFEAKNLEEYKAKSNIPGEIKSGFLVEVHTVIIEGANRRVQVFKGLVIDVTKKGVRSTITVRKTAHGCGVERTFPIYNHHRIEKIVVVRKNKVRRANLFYIRNLSAKKARLKEIKEDKNS